MTKLKEGASSPRLPWRSISVIAITVRLILTSRAPIADCDEVYNYWEPLHYLSFGSGMQTWEYSPAYALRTYFYLLPLHALSQLLLRLTSISKPTLFVLLRSTLSLVTSHAEIRFARSLPLGNDDNDWLKLATLVMSLTSAGFYHAGSSLLPSATVMQLVMISYADFFEGRVWRAIAWGAVGVLG
eukprot:CAMPEP_0172500480 /NCGR_PEP_ID=MMETSP1066-20121228/138963_1 /TAXON_ID=671091 /ORGANISM="Coscinodiscus wailesii, Strain CCMP2513" /LENGTH=184 /DNA_ID=CAMNT_0013274741 /DNA_START=127 /DNA_END=677 /DNA_ORIENTATION=-